MSESNYQETHLILLLITLISASGLISNLLPTIYGISLGTFFVDTLLLFCNFIFFIKLFIKNKISLCKFFVILYFFLFASIILIKSTLDINPIWERIIGFRDCIFYATPMIFIPFLNLEHKLIIKYIANLLGIICTFAISQYLFRGVYPDALLKLHLEENAFNFYASDIVRVNGLVGNPLIFTAFAVMAVNININMFVKLRSNINLFWGILSFIALILTFSRAAWVIGSIAIIFNVIAINKLNIKNLLLIMIAVSTLCSYSYSWIYNNQDSFFYKRLFSQEASTQGSDFSHRYELLNAIDKITEMPLLGTGLGSQGSNASNKIITDGWLLQTFLQFGVPLGIFYIIFLVFLLIYCFIIIKNKYVYVDILSAVISSSVIYFIATSVINSAFFGRVVYVTFFVMIGLLFNMRLNRNTINT